MAAHPDPRPTLILNPSDDAEFRALAMGLIDDGGDSPAALERRLRERHPRAVVRPRELSGERSSVWYVYRDGRWVGARH